MRDLLVAGIIFGLLPFILWRPHIGILAWSWIGYMNPHRLTWGFAFNFPFAQIVGIVALISIVFSKEKVRIPLNSTTLIWGAFVLWMCVTTAFALHPGDSLAGLEKSLKIQLFAWLTVGIMQSRDRLLALLWVIVGSLGFFGLKGGLFAFRTGGEGRVWGPPGSFLEDNNALGMALVMTIPLMVYLAMHLEGVWKRRAMFALITVTALSALSTQSRGALLASAAMLGMLWLKSSRKGVVLVAIAVLAPALIAFMPQKWSDRMMTITTFQEDNSAMGRLTAWEFAIDMAMHRPLGGGFDSFHEETYRMYSPEISAQIDQRDGRFQEAHSIYFKVLGEHGFVGLFLFLSLILSAYRCGSWIRARASKLPEHKWMGELAAMLQVSLVGYCTGGAFLGLPYFDYFYHLVGMLIILKVMLQREMKSLAAATPAAPNAALRGRRRPLATPNQATFSRGEYR